LYLFVSLMMEIIITMMIQTAETCGLRSSCQWTPPEDTLGRKTREA